MNVELTAEQQESQAGSASSSGKRFAPCRSLGSRGRMPREIVGRLAGKGYLGALIPAEYGGTFTDMITFGLLHEEVGRGCSSVRSLLTVHGMLQYAVLRWGSDGLREAVAAAAGPGRGIGAFGLTEPNTGSDARSIETSARKNEGTYILNGTKVWNTFGQFATVYLIFAQQEGKSVRFLWSGTGRGSRSHP